MLGGREIWIVAGEPSGDTHAAHLLAALARHAPDTSFRGFGGPRMRDAGMEVLHDLASDAIMGLFPVVAALPRIWKLFRQAVRELRERRPAALVLVDYPGFNIRLAAKAHAMGIPVIYYISPQVWAWARWRTKKLARICDLMLVILPFEADVYRHTGLETVFVGHPLMDHLQTVDHDTDLIGKLRKGVPEGAPVVGLFPGSRRSVVASLAPVFADAARDLRARDGTRGARIVVACAQERFRPLIESHLDGLDATVLIGKPYEVMEAADLALTSSGTTTLEIAAHGTPFVIGYRVSPVMYALGRMLISVPHIGLVNLVAERRLVPEHIGVRAFANEAADDLHRLWTDPEVRQAQVAGLAEVRNRLQSKGSYDRAAAAIANRLG